jgi:hypothetical protein
MEGNQEAGGESCKDSRQDELALEPPNSTKANNGLIPSRRTAYLGVFNILQR